MVHRGPRTGSWRARRSLASGHSRAREFTGDGATEGGEHGESISSLTGVRAAVWRSGDGVEASTEKELGGSGARAQREGESEGRTRGESRWGRLPFIGAKRRWGEAATDGLRQR
jgi:hypothetical protein